MRPTPHPPLDLGFYSTSPLFAKLALLPSPQEPWPNSSLSIQRSISSFRLNNKYLSMHMWHVQRITQIGSGINNLDSAAQKLGSLTLPMKLFRHWHLTPLYSLKFEKPPLPLCAMVDAGDCPNPTRALACVLIPRTSAGTLFSIAKELPPTPFMVKPLRDLRDYRTLDPLAKVNWRKDKALRNSSS
jgi:hypothetical protein